MAYKTVKNIWFLLTATVIVILGIAVFSRAHAFDKYETHPALTEEIIKFYNSFAEQKITFEELNLIKLGSQKEDESPRWLNHYYDAINNRGLVAKYLRGSPRVVSNWEKAIGVSSPKDPIASINWVKNENYQVLFGANRTWDKAIRGYFDNKEQALIALGSILHLLEDLGVPEHARADGHIDLFQSFFHEVPSYYEKFAEKVDISSLNIANNLIKNQEQIKEYSNIEAIFRDLSQYTANNWFSEDTIGVKEFESPQIYNSLIRKDTNYDYIFNYDNKNRLISVDIINQNPNSENYNQVIRTTNQKDINSQWLLAITPQIVKYGASLVNLYFNEIEKRKTDETNLYIDRLEARDRRVGRLFNAIANLPELFKAKTKLAFWRAGDILANTRHKIENFLSSQKPEPKISINDLQALAKSTIDANNNEKPDINNRQNLYEEIIAKPATPLPIPLISPLPNPAETQIKTQKPLIKDLNTIPDVVQIARNSNIAPSRPSYAVVTGGQSNPQPAQTDKCELLKSNSYPKIIISEIRYESTRTDADLTRTDADLTRTDADKNIKDEYIELYNPNSTDISLDCFEFKKHTSGNTESILIPQSKFQGTIAPDSFFLISHPEVQDKYQSDLIYAQSYSFSKNNSLILIDPSGKISDLIGFGDDSSKISKYETSPYLQISNSEFLISNYSIERINLIDTDNNAADFWLSSSNPENTKSPSRVPRIDFANLINLQLKNFLATFDSEENKINLQFTEPDFSFSGANYEYKVAFATATGSQLPTTSSRLSLSDFGASTIMPMPNFNNKNFYFDFEITKCPVSQSNFIIYVQLQDKIFAQNSSPAASANLNLADFCQSAIEQKDHSQDDNLQTQPGKILISEIKIRSASSTKHEYIELYNPNQFAVSLNNFSLIKTNKNNSDQTILPQSKFKAVIGPHSFFLLANELATELVVFGILPDLTWSKSYDLAKNNSIKLLDSADNVLDSASWQNPSYQALERKAGVNSTSETLRNPVELDGEKPYGNSFDTDSETDFVLSEPEPQNSEFQEIPPLSPRKLNYTLNNATLTVSFISPYQYLIGDIKYETRVIEADWLDEEQIIPNWNSLKKINAILPVFRYGGYNEQFEFSACSQIKQNNWLALGVISGNSLIAFDGIKIADKIECPVYHNLTFQAEHYLTGLTNPMLREVIIRNETKNTQLTFNTAHNYPNYSTTDYFELSKSNNFSHSISYSTASNYNSIDNYDFDLNGFAINSDNTENIIYSEKWIDKPTNQFSPKTKTLLLQIPEDAIKLKITLDVIKQDNSSQALKEIMEIVIE